jgi:hypothetical protein
MLATRDELGVWPANLPPGARWLPYQPRPDQPDSSITPAESPPRPSTPITPFRPKLSRHSWRVVLAAVAGAGLIGLGGGMFVGLVFGIH